jgi:hypothetical protein
MGIVTDSDDDHASPLRGLMAEALGGGYVSFASLAEARAQADGAVILEGDDGGQLYVAFPASTVSCSERSLEILLRDLDAISWPGNDENMARVVYERRAIGDGVSGGMGGGVITQNGWVHPALAALGIEVEIRSVLNGARERLSVQTRALVRP